MEGTSKMSKHSASINDAKPNAGPSDEPNPKPSSKPNPRPNPKTVEIALMINAKYRITGKYSGREYLFQNAGATQNVDERDVDWLINLNRGNVCCGGGTRPAMFALVKGQQNG